MAVVTVIVPNYNHAPYLERRIGSILSQSFQDFEVILMDDCSSDCSREILDKYRHHPRVKELVYNDRNSGSPFIQWRKGVQRATTELIWIAESDDWCEISFLEELVESFRKSNGTVLGFCQVTQCTDDSIIGVSKANALATIVDGRIYAREKLLCSNYISNASAVLFRRSAFLKVPEDYTRMKYAGDWWIWYHICLQGDVFISGKHLCYWYKHPQDVTSNARRMGWIFSESLPISQKILIELGCTDDEYVAVYRHWKSRWERQRVNQSRDVVTAIDALFHTFSRRNGIPIKTARKFLRRAVAKGKRAVGLR